jgi:two-component system, NarL family, sensor kinase
VNSESQIELARRNRELSILNTIAEALNREVHLGQALDTTLAAIVELFELRTGWIWLIDESHEAHVAAVQHLPPALADNPERMRGTCYCLDMFRAGDLESAANISTIACSRLKKLIDGTDGLRYHASIPLQAHGRPLGVLNVASADWRQLTPDDLRLLYTIGDLLSIAIERSRLFEQSAEMGALEERNRLAREIHDTLAQSLTAITLKLEAADALLDTSADPSQVHTAIEQALDLVRGSLEDARRSVMNLRAAPLEGRTLTQALAELISAIQRMGPAEVRCLSQGASERLSARVALGLYRIAQEALGNAQRYAQASIITLALVIDTSATLTIEDNGVGFEPAQVAPGHFGLIGMSERAHLLNGELRLWSAPGQGTCITVEVPL